jgi:hypothetical protein
VLPTLQSTLDLVVNANTSLQTLELPGLEYLYGTFTVESNTSLQSVSAPLMLFAQDALEVIGNSSLTSIDVSGMSSAGALRVSANPSLPALAAPVLGSAESLAVFDNFALATLDVPQLTELFGGELDLHRNGASAAPADDAASLTCGEIDTIVQALVQCPTSLQARDAANADCGVVCN